MFSFIILRHRKYNHEFYKLMKFNFKGKQYKQNVLSKCKKERKKDIKVRIIKIRDLFSFFNI